MHPAQVDFSQSVYHLWKQFRQQGSKQAAPAPGSGQQGPGGQDKQRFELKSGAGGYNTSMQAPHQQRQQQPRCVNNRSTSCSCHLSQMRPEEGLSMQLAESSSRILLPCSARACLQAGRAWQGSRARQAR